MVAAEMAARWGRRTGSRAFRFMKHRSFCLFNAGVAQLVERPIRNRKVISSTLIVSSITKPTR